MLKVLEMGKQVDSRRWFYRLLVITAVMTYLLIVMGGIVRVTGSGLGCPDWPTCYGRWIPPLRMDAILEYLHRLAATFASPLILSSGVVAWWKHREARMISRPLLWAVVLLGVQGLLGGIVVLTETPPNLVAVHLGVALVILALIILPGIAAHEIAAGRQTRGLVFRHPFAHLSLWTLAAVFVVLISGAIVIASRSTFACPGWPLCGGALFPDHLPGWIQMGHRALVGATAVLVVILAVKARRLGGETGPALRSVATLAAILYFAQAGIGALKVNYFYPTLMMGMHVATAAAIWAALVVLVGVAGMRLEEG